VDVYCPPSEVEEEIYRQMSERRVFEIPRPYVELTKKIGEGEFGEVYQGVWSSPSGQEEVAVKVTKNNSSEKDKIKLLQEAVTVGQFSHPHVVKLYGALTLNDPIMMVLELLPEGDLRNHLMSLREK
jgi:serine/threonine protein kinase